MTVSAPGALSIIGNAADGFFFGIILPAIIFRISEACQTLRDLTVIQFLLKRSSHSCDAFCGDEAILDPRAPENPSKRFTALTLRLSLDDS